MSGDRHEPADRASDLLTVTLVSTGSEPVIAVKGELDAATAPLLGAAADEAIRPTEVVGLVLDFEELRFLDSAGLRVIIRVRNELREHRGGSIRIVNAAGIVARVLEITGIDQVLSD
ncbi:MAG: hypothetical protein JWN46_614 [Acidimicrobiales bacterium]|nr:hypothetical protein [Acidimicrobiales bacterium]